MFRCDQQSWEGAQEGWRKAIIVLDGQIQEEVGAGAWAFGIGIFLVAPIWDCNEFTSTLKDISFWYNSLSMSFRTMFWFRHLLFVNHRDLQLGMGRWNASNAATFMHWVQDLTTTTYLRGYEFQHRQVVIMVHRIWNCSRLHKARKAGNSEYPLETHSLLSGPVHLGHHSMTLFS